MSRVLVPLAPGFEEIVRDGSVVTSRGAGTAIEFALVEALVDGATAARPRQQMVVPAAASN